MTDWALVSGASRGIGRAIARELAKIPVHIVVNFRSSTADAEAVVHDIETAGGSAETACFDVANDELTAAALESLIARRGAPYIVVNNAGIARDGLMVWMKQTEWSEVLATNLTGFFNVTRACLKPMLSARRGRIIN